MPGIPFHSRLAASWIAKFRDYKSRLLGEPAHHDAWQWHIQIKVLNYLIFRYGPDPYLDEHCTRVGIIALSPAIRRLPEDGKSLRSRSDLRLVLDRIAEINRLKAI